MIWVCHIIFISSHSSWNRHITVPLPKLTVVFSITFSFRRHMYSKYTEECFIGNLLIVDTNMLGETIWAWLRTFISLLNILCSLYGFWRNRGTILIGHLQICTSSSEAFPQGSSSGANTIPIKLRFPRSCENYDCWFFFVYAAVILPPSACESPSQLVKMDRRSLCVFFTLASIPISSSVYISVKWKLTLHI